MYCNSVQGRIFFESVCWMTTYCFDKKVSSTSVHSKDKKNSLPGNQCHGSGTVASEKCVFSLVLKLICCVYRFCFMLYFVRKIVFLLTVEKNMLTCTFEFKAVHFYFHFFIIVVHCEYKLLIN